ncbi:MAG: hypothetical protein EON54_28170 [Alcaligenaceae bacterium]|nr:MAG: hypothetical protein EON54_28170 [Alcaligenaceae bacterium]
MRRKAFVDAIFEAALKQGYKIDSREPKGRRIWFNEPLRKYLWEGDIAKLYPGLLNQQLSVSEANALIEAVAPGKTTTHVGMRKLVAQIRTSLS